MGMDIGLVEYHGKNKQGYLKTKSVEDEFNWNADRFVIRHEISKNIKMLEIDSGIYMDLEAIYRPTDFDEAFSWANTLENADKEYVKQILLTLQKRDNLYLTFSY